MLRSQPRRVAVQRKRRVLGELDTNHDLNLTRSRPAKRAPIIFEKENKTAVLEGVRRGIYDLNEVVALTDYQGTSPTVSVGNTRIASQTQPQAQHPSPAIPHLEDSPLEDEEVEMEDNDIQVSELAARDPQDHPDGGLEEEPEHDEPEPEDGGLDPYGYREPPDDETYYSEEYMDEDDFDDDQEHDGSGQAQEPPFDPAAIGLKEINNLAHFGVSSHKPGNGVAELLSEDTDKYWQSDGQQPHLLTMHFVRRVEIRAIRFYVDYNQDESYTPTNIVFYAGTSSHDLIQFAEVPLANPVGWQNVPISDAGGGHDGHSLCCWVVQMHVKENHQNGKDTHIRGIKIYGLDENLLGGVAPESVQEPSINLTRPSDRATLQNLAVDEDETLQELLDSFDRYPLSGAGSFSNFPEFMREPEIR
ncbi:galactose-binding domain-like protein [Apiosordaria backusii]|uniref:Galactose-binding domain-like protein n=1 Tax=Apiosordaria backusii TaxID=314023 RepID=A0AA40BKU9_9PEZI|nr:galactose-binding domain-like protein [Apiosordaria backusii]